MVYVNPALTLKCVTGLGICTRSVRISVAGTCDLDKFGFAYRVMIVMSLKFYKLMASRAIKAAIMYAWGHALL